MIKQSPRLPANNPKITKTNGYDRMSTKVTFPTGEYILVSLSRRGMNITINNPTIPDEDRESDVKCLQQFMQFKPGETNQQRFDRFETIAKNYKDYISLIKNLK